MSPVNITTSCVVKIKHTLAVGLVLLLDKYTGLPSKVVALIGARGIVKTGEPVDVEPDNLVGSDSSGLVNEVEVKGSFDRGGSS